MLRRYFVFVVFFILCFLVGCSGNVFPALNKEVAASRQATASAPIMPHNIALLLPLSGQLAQTSQAIRNGFLAAYSASSDKSKINIKIINTSGGNIGDLYHQALVNGAQVIVGPLTKTEVAEVQRLEPLSVPIIALNTVDDYAKNPVANLYQFGLLPQDEAIQAAMKMLSDNHQHAAVIAVNNQWGRKISATFKEKYQANGGDVVVDLDFTNNGDLANQVCNIVAADPSEMCVKVSRKNRHDRDRPVPVRRQDIDAIFLVASPAEARQIVPLLKFYYAGDLPVYSISAIYSGVNQPTADQDLDGVIFCDMPWVLRDEAALSPTLTAIRNQVVSVWPDAAGNFGKLYALGVDAYNLATSLNTLTAAPQSGIPGATGVLYLDNYNHIYRELTWVQFQAGVPIK
ncbi:MAG: penicillin-binding protein activator [Gammaproteobacteria bacterium]|nr:penicillin-binding protein activator [Gammaproteobacteria bacterium]